MKKDKWQNKDDQNVKVAMAFKALINRKLCHNRLSALLPLIFFSNSHIYYKNH